MCFNHKIQDLNLFLAPPQKKTSCWGNSKLYRSPRIGHKPWGKSCNEFHNRFTKRYCEVFRLIRLIYLIVKILQTPRKHNKKCTKLTFPSRFSVWALFQEVLETPVGLILDRQTLRGDRSRVLIGYLSGVIVVCTAKNNLPYNLNYDNYPR